MKIQRSFFHWLYRLFFGRTAHICISPETSLESFIKTITICFLEVKDPEGKTFVFEEDLVFEDFDSITFGEVPRSITFCSRGVGITLAVLTLETYEMLFCIYSRLEKGKGIKINSTERYSIDVSVLQVQRPVAT